MEEGIVGCEGGDAGDGVSEVGSPSCVNDLDVVCPIMILRYCFLVCTGSEIRAYQCAKKIGNISAERLA